jgi:hypothetical protein
MSISLSGLNNIINAFNYRDYYESYTYRNPVVTGYFDSQRRGIFRIIRGTVSIATNTWNNFWIRVPLSDFSMWQLFGRPGENFSANWVYQYNTSYVSGTYDDYGGVYATGNAIIDNANGEIGYQYVYIEFWQKQLAQGNRIKSFSFIFVGFA